LQIEPSPVTDAELLDRTLRTALALPAQVDLSGVAYGETEGWDSVAHMNLILAIEEAFGINLDADDVVEMSSYAAAARVLRERHGLAVDG
jgi:acyl carrier protein